MSLSAHCYILTLLSCYIVKFQYCNNDTVFNDEVLQVSNKTFLDFSFSYLGNFWRDARQTRDLAKDHAYIVSS